MTFPTKFSWRQCPCGHKLCKRQYPENFGTFSMGTGFEPAEVEILDRMLDLANNIRPAFAQQLTLDLKHA